MIGSGHQLSRATGYSASRVGRLGAKRNRLRHSVSIASALVAIATVGLAEEAWAADAGPLVTMSVSPDTAKLPPDGSADVIVVIDNASANRIGNVIVSFVAPAAVVAAPNRVGPLTIRAGAAAALEFTLRQTSVGALPATVLFRIDYQVPTRGRQGPLSRTLVSSLPIATHEGEVLDHVAKVVVHSKLTALDDFHGGDVVLVISNTSAGTVHVTDVIPQEKKGVIFQRERFGAPKAILPGHQLAIPIAISLEKGAALRSGEEVLLFTVELAWGGGKTLRTANIIVTHDVNLGVFAESEVAELLKIPSFLLLPGFLFIVTLALMWRAGSRFKKLPNEPILGNALIFAYFIVVTSMLLILVYRLRTSRDLRAGYNFSDIIAISRDSIIVAIVVFSAGYVGHLAYLQWRFPTERDSSITSLRKLARQGLGLELHDVTIKAGTAKGQAWLYETRDRDGVVRAVGPAIGVKYNVRNPDLQKEVNRYRQAGDDPGGLARLLAEASKTNSVTVYWMRRPGLEHLTLVTAENVEVDDAKTLIVEEEV